MSVDYYEPHGWVIVKFIPVDAPTFYKIFELHEGVITWPQTSGSIYKLRVDGENCTTFYTSRVLDNILERSKANGIDCELIRFNDT